MKPAQRAGQWSARRCRRRAPRPALDPEAPKLNLPPATAVNRPEEPGGAPLALKAMSNPVKRLVAYAAIDSEERVLAGRVSGWLYALGGVTVTSFLLLPGLGETHWE